MAQIIPIKELKNTAVISDMCKASGEPIFITKNGYGDMVIMNIDVYNRTIAKLDVILKLREAEIELENGVEGVDALEFLTELKAKYENV
ncbi:MAG: type II toxin-antitoxin system Phd/YefM family antitoxin [Clostridia bacterium]|nr:type II toxin-antitoxin system Phd/YefM family antitoxin [Clostridia bacterium]